MKKIIIAFMFFIGCFSLLPKNPPIIPLPQVYESQSNTLFWITAWLSILMMNGALSEATWGASTNFSDYEDRLRDHLLL